MQVNDSIYHSHYGLSIFHCLAPGAPQSLRMASVDVSSIIIQWDRVNCLERNGHIDSYTVFFYPTSNPNERESAVILGTGDDDRMFNLTGLPPRTGYQFEIHANNPLLRGVTGAVATINVRTTAPQSKINSTLRRLFFAGINV